MQPKKTLDNAVALVAEQQDEVSDFEKHARAIEVTNEDEAAFVVTAIAEVKERHKALDTKRKEWVAPLKAVAGDIDKTFRPVLRSLKATEDALKKALASYRVRQEEERNKALRAAGEAETEAERSDHIQRATAHDPGEHRGAGFKAIWRATVVDESAAVQWCLENNRPEFLSINVKAIAAQAQAVGERMPKIAGVNVEKDFSVRITSGKVEK